MNTHFLTARAWITRALQLLAAVIFPFLAVRGADSNPPERLAYQGYLVDGDGNPLGTTAPQNYDVIFRLFDDQIAGTLKWSEQQTVTVDAGYFSVLLGEGSQVASEPHPPLSGAFGGADASDRFLALTVKRIGPSNSDLDILPRMQMLTSPYSFLARNAVNAQNAANAANLLSGGGVQAANVLEFGLNVAGKEANAGKIGYQRFSDGLDVVGAGTSSTDRRITLWAEGGTLLHGSASILGSVAAAGGMLARGGPPGANGVNNNGFAFSGNGGDNDSGMFSTADGLVQFYINAEEKVRVNSGGLWADNTFIGDMGHGYEWGGIAHKDIAGVNHFALLQHQDGTKTLLNAVGGENSQIAFLFDNSPKMTLNYAGNVGIGSTTPSARLTIASPDAYNGDLLRIYSTAEPDAYNLTLRSTVSSGLVKYLFDLTNGGGAYPNNLVLDRGRVGIGTDTPAVPLHVATWVAYPLTDSPDGFSNNGGFNSSFSLGTAGGGVFDLAILADGWIGGWGIVANSDRRIKEIAGRSDASLDLEVIRKLAVTDFRHIDRARDGGAIRKGFIAQEVAEILPQAVSKRRDFIPDVYAHATGQQFDAESGTLEITLGKAHGLATAVVVRLVADGKVCELPIEAVTSENSFTVKWAPNVDPRNPESVFVYGRRVDDFLSVDYDHLFTVGISALQELDRQFESWRSSQARLAELEKTASRVNELERKLAVLEGAMTRLTAQIENHPQATPAKDTPARVTTPASLTTTASVTR